VWKFSGRRQGNQQDGEQIPNRDVSAAEYASNCCGGIATISKRPVSRRKEAQIMNLRMASAGGRCPYGEQQDPNRPGDQRMWQSRTGEKTIFAALPGR
jgi:hypothetical protein